MPEQSNGHSKEERGQTKEAILKMLLVRKKQCENAVAHKMSIVYCKNRTNVKVKVPDADRDGLLFFYEDVDELKLDPITNRIPRQHNKVLQDMQAFMDNEIRDVHAVPHFIIESGRKEALNKKKKKGTKTKSRAGTKKVTAKKIPKKGRKRPRSNVERSSADSDSSDLEIIGAVIKKENGDAHSSAKSGHKGNGAKSQCDVPLDVMLQSVKSNNGHCDVFTSFSQHHQQLLMVRALNRMAVPGTKPNVKRVYELQNEDFSKIHLTIPKDGGLLNWPGPLREVVSIPVKGQGNVINEDYREALDLVLDAAEEAYGMLAAAKSLKNGPNVKYGHSMSRPPPLKKQKLNTMHSGETTEEDEEDSDEDDDLRFGVNDENTNGRKIGGQQTVDEEEAALGLLSLGVQPLNVRGNAVSDASSITSFKADLLEKVKDAYIKKVISLDDLLAITVTDDDVKDD